MIKQSITLISWLIGKIEYSGISMSCQIHHFRMMYGFMLRALEFNQTSLSSFAGFSTIKM